MIRADLTLVPDPVAPAGEDGSAPLRRSAPTSRTSAKAPETQAFPPPAPVPVWARAGGGAGEDPLFAAGAGLALLDAFLRRDPPAAGALRSRLALMSAAASAKILRLNADVAAFRDLRFAVAAGPLPAAKLRRLWRDLAAALDAGRVAVAAAVLDLPAPNGVPGLASQKCQRSPTVPGWLFQPKKPQHICLLHLTLSRRPIVASATRKHYSRPQRIVKGTPAAEGIQSI